MARRKEELVGRNRKDSRQEVDVGIRRWKIGLSFHGIFLSFFWQLVHII
jgi:hypothetical protein